MIGLLLTVTPVTFEPLHPIATQRLHRDLIEQFDLLKFQILVERFKGVGAVDARGFLNQEALRIFLVSRPRPGKCIDACFRDGHRIHLLDLALARRMSLVAKDTRIGFAFGLLAGTP